MECQQGLAQRGKWSRTHGAFGEFLLAPRQLLDWLLLLGLVSGCRGVLARGWGAEQDNNIIIETVPQKKIVDCLRWGLLPDVGWLPVRSFSRPMSRVFG